MPHEMGSHLMRALHEPHEPEGSGAGVPPAAGASRPRIHRGRDARADSRNGRPTTVRHRFMVPMHVEKRTGASLEPKCSKAKAIISAGKTAVPANRRTAIRRR